VLGDAPGEGVGVVLRPGQRGLPWGEAADEGEDAAQGQGAAVVVAQVDAVVPLEVSLEGLPPLTQESEEAPDSPRLAPAVAEPTASSSAIRSAWIAFGWLA